MGPIWSRIPRTARFKCRSINYFLALGAHSAVRWKKNLYFPESCSPAKCLGKFPSWRGSSQLNLTSQRLGVKNCQSHACFNSFFITQSNYRLSNSNITNCSRIGHIFFTNGTYPFRTLTSFQQIWFWRVPAVSNRCQSSLIGLYMIKDQFWLNQL